LYQREGNSRGLNDIRLPVTVAIRLNVLCALAEKFSAQISATPELQATAEFYQQAKSIGNRRSEVDRN
jgi:hypothetical protein